MMLIKILVVMGKYILKFSFSMRMSPGSLPRNGILFEYCIAKPTPINSNPKSISAFPIPSNKLSYL